MSAKRASFVAGVIAFAAVLGHGGEARADLSSWYSIGFGTTHTKATGYDARWRYQLPFDVGFGTPVSLPVVVGLGARFTPVFLEGIDWAAYARMATQGYATGRFGVAVDGGIFSHTYGPGSTGWLATLNLGGPWGLVATSTYQQGTNDARAISFGIAIDFLRLTVYRLGNESQWPNVNPAYRPEAPPPK